MLTNVKSRGGWGEVQLGALLAEMLTPGAVRAERRDAAREPASASSSRSSFPGRGEDGAPCWLPIDAKFPLEDYQRLQEAIERADVDAVEASRKALEAFFKAEARSIRDKYVEPPHTTDFAILFVPTEGLYAEAVSRPGLADALQREFRVMLAGPMNLAAMLNSLQLGFRTLAIEKRSTEVWRVLGAVKTEFGKFGEILAKTKETARPGRQDARRRRPQEHDDRAQAARRRGAAGSRGRPPADRRRRRRHRPRARAGRRRRAPPAALDAAAADARQPMFDALPQLAARARAAQRRRSPTRCGATRSRALPFLALYTDGRDSRACATWSCCFSTPRASSARAGTRSRRCSA